MLVQFYNVSKIYSNGVKALDDVSLKIERGEFLFLMGPSGAGKSTLIKLFFREEVPTRGQIFIASRSIVRMKRSEVPPLRRNIGIIFQDFKLLENKTASENIAFAMEVVGANPKEIRQRVAEVIEMVGLKGRENSFPGELSGGATAGRVLPGLWPIALSCLLPMSLREIWILIFPEIMELLFDINRKGTTVIMATHARELVKAARKRVILLDKGRVIADNPNGESII